MQNKWEKSMKKLIISIISILSAISVAFGMAGCANDNSQKQQTEIPKQETPKDPSEPQFEFDYTKFNPSCNWSYNETYCKDYMEYLNTEYKKVCDETFYLWTPNDYDWGTDHFNSEGYFYGIEYKQLSVAAFKDKNTGKCSNTHISQSIIIYPQEWNGDKLPHYDREENEDVNLLFVSGAVELSGSEGELKLVINKETNIYTDVFVNIYLGETCIATCYVNSISKYCTYSWIEEYLKNHIEVWNN